jgi:phage gpG-like protein
VSFEFELDVTGPVSEFKAMADRAEDLTPVMERAEEKIASAIDGNFASESDARGGGWQALADSTMRDRARLGYGATNPILERDGALRRAATSLREHDNESAQVGAPDGHPSANALDRGYSYNNRTLPARTFIDVGDDILDDIEKDIIDYIEGV